MGIGVLPTPIRPKQPTTEWSMVLGYRISINATLPLVIIHLWLDFNVHQEKDHTTQAYESSGNSHNCASHGFGFYNIRLSTAIAVAGIF